MPRSLLTPTATATRDNNPVRTTWFALALLLMLTLIVLLCASLSTPHPDPTPASPRAHIRALPVAPNG